MDNLNEGYNIEYKEEIPKKVNKLKAEIVSFLNSDTGGTIYLGVKDDGTLIKFPDKRQKYKEWEELLNNWVATAFSPEVTGLIMIDPNSEPFKISISSGEEKPYYFKDGEGINYKGIYIRNGSSKRLASDDEIKRMINNPLVKSFDSRKIGKTDLEFGYAKQVFLKEKVKFDIIGLDFKKNEDDSYNNAALIVSDENPYISKTAIYEGLSVNSFKDKKRFEGSIAKQIDEVVRYIHLSNRVKITLGNNGRRIEQYSYPIDAVREAVMNAFVHRDYTLSADIRIELYDDRLEISSPGSLPEGLTIADIKHGANAKRNPILINALDKMNYIENYGSGIRRIYSLYEEFLRQPKLITTNNLFTVVLYNMNYKPNTFKLDDNMFAIVSYLSGGKLASRKEIQDALNLQKSYTSEIIATMKKKGILLSEGRGRATKYYLATDNTLN